MIQKFIKGVLDDSVESISGMDATFLYSESSTSPMHIASLVILEGSISFEKFKSRLISKTHLFPKFKKRLLRLPLDLDFPYWADDPDFDVDIHLQKVALPAPSNWESLRELVSSVFSTPLDLRRPLWSIHFIEGLDNLSQLPKGSVAILTKVHHVMIDGMSGVGILESLMSSDPGSSDLLPQEINESRVRPLPDDLTLLAKSSLKLIKNPLRLPKIVGKFAINSLKTQFEKSVMPTEQLIESTKVPFTIFNKAVGSKRTWGTTIISLDRVKKIKNKKKVTINDIIVAICAGALRKYMIERDVLPSESLVANIPVSTRAQNVEGQDGNQITSMFIPIGTDIEDPLARLELINEHTHFHKKKLNTVGASSLTEMADAVPFGLANLSARIYSRYQVKEMVRPPFNVTITNVPGPRTPLYLNGKKVNNIMGLTPVVNGFGLIIAIFSYDGKLTLTATSDAKTMPDADKFARDIRHSANELEELILNEEEESQKEMPFESLSFFDLLKKGIKRKDADFQGVYHFEIDNTVSQIHYTLDGSKEKTSLRKSKPKKADLHIRIEDKNLKKLMDGKLHLDEAVIQGRVGLKGDKSQWEPLEKLLNDILEK